LHEISQAFQTSADEFNLAYLVSSKLPAGWLGLVFHCKKNGIPLVSNVDGFAYPAWHGSGWQVTNSLIGVLARNSSKTLFQSNFSKLCAHKFLGDSAIEGEVLYNAVNTDFFSPRDTRNVSGAPTILLAGNQYEKYRVENALEAFALFHKKYPLSKLKITGRVDWINFEASCKRQTMAMIRGMGLAESVELTGPYTRDGAREVYRGADILLHTKENDPCPGVVIEALACGLPVVYPANGGVPELVGSDCGVGVSSSSDWQKVRPAHAQGLADGLEHCWVNLKSYSESARSRALKMFDQKQWMERHRQIFLELIASTR